MKKLVVLFAAFALLAGSAFAQIDAPGGGSCALCLKTTGGTMTGALSFTGSGKLASAFPIAVGTGTATANLSGTYAKFVSGAGVGNGADLTDDALWTLTAIPANAFTANGDDLVLTLGFVGGATGNNKRIGLTVGGSQVNSQTVTTSAFVAQIIATIQRVDATHVNVILGGVEAGGTFFGSSTNLVVSDLTANTLAIVVTGASPTTGAANDVKLFSGIADFKK